MRILFKRAKTLNKRGFTLVELIVTIAVIAILSSIILPTMSSSNNRQLQERYKQSCISVLNSADSILAAVNKGAKVVSGFQIIKSDGSFDYNELKSCLKLENVNAADYDIACFDVDAKNNGSTGTLPSSYSNYAKDLVVIYIQGNNFKDNYTAVGGIYFQKAKRRPEARIKYDYVLGTTITISRNFSNPYKK